MSDMLQLVVKIINIRLRRNLSADNLDDKLKHVGHKHNGHKKGFQ